MNKLIILIMLNALFSSLVSAQHKFFTRASYSNALQYTLNYPIEINNNYFCFGSLELSAITLEKFNLSGSWSSDSVVLLPFNDPPTPSPSFYSNFWNTHKYRHINGKIYIPSEFSYPLPYRWLRTPSLTVIDTNGIQAIYHYTFPNPTSFDYYDYSVDNFIYAQGETRRDTADLQSQATDCIVMKIDTHGNEIWRYNIRTSAQYKNGPAGILATADSGCLVSYLYGPYPAYSNGRIIKLNKNGQLQWVKNLPFSGGIESLSLIDYNDTDGSLILRHVPFNPDDNYYVAQPIVKLNNAMQKEWDMLPYRQDSFFSIHPWKGDTTYHYVVSSGINGVIRATSNKGYIGCGIDKRDSTGKFNGVVNNGYVMFIKDSGKAVWEATYQSKDLGVKELYFNAINTTSDGGYLLTGSCRDSLNNQVGFLMKIDSLGCLSDDSCEARFFTSIRYYEPEATSWSIYPNPTTDKLHIAIADAPDYRYAIADLQGRKLAEGQLDTEKSISIGHLEKGIYIVSLMDRKGNVFSKKVVRE